MEEKNLNEENITSETEETVVEPQKPSKPHKSVWQEIKEWIVALVSALIVVFLIHTFLFTLIRVDGSSMYSTLVDKERLFVTVTDVRFGAVDRGDIVICHYPNRGWTNFVKRVVATPGDQVYRKMGVTHVVYEEKNASGEVVTVDQPLDENFVSIFYNLNDDYEPYTLGADEFFVVGDNRGNSHDSRDWNDSDPSRDVGPITRKMITGHVRCVFWPLNKIRIVH